MKKMKRISSVLLALALVLSLATTAFAADADLSDHTYTAYQIFAGTQAENDAKLAVTGWGDGVNGDALLTALQANTAFLIADTSEGAAEGATVNAFAGCTTAAEVAAVLAANEGFAQDFAETVEQHIVAGKGIPVVNGQTELEAGYYLVVDTTENTDGKYEAVNLSLLQLTQKDTFTIAVKVDVPEVEKKVKDTNDSTNETSNWQDSADYDIGNDVPFQITASMPTDLANYDTYKLVFHDTQSEGLTFNNDVKVYVVNGNTTTEVNSEKYTVSTTNNDSHTLDVTIADVLTLTDKDGNAISVTAASQIVVEYTAKLNDDAKLGSTGNENKVYLEYSNNPNHGGSGETGKTPEDKVVVFTYQLTVNKVDEDNKALNGATFTLYKYDADATTEDKWVEVKTIDGTELSTFVFTGLDDGQYKLVETKVPAGYNQAADVEFTITATHDTEAPEPKLVTLTSSNSAVTVETTGEEGSETYTGNLNTTVINRSGTTLPETGGMGTTMFYIVGVILVLAAAVLLVTKRRMNTAE